jgi:hypothetical protein
MLCWSPLVRALSYLTPIGLLSPLSMGLPPKSSPPHYRSFEPLCDLEALNVEYAAALNYKRRLACPTARSVYFDRNLLLGTVLHNQRMAQKDSLYHYQTFHAELAGSHINADECRGNARKLARYIWTRFNESPAHAATQRDTSLRFVSISCSEKYFIVRLDDKPSPRHEDEVRLYRQWQARSRGAN